MRDCITMCFDICTINIRVGIRVRGLHLVFFPYLFVSHITCPPHSKTFDKCLKNCWASIDPTDFCHVNYCNIKGIAECILLSFLWPIFLFSSICLQDALGFACNDLCLSPIFLPFEALIFAFLSSRVCEEILSFHGPHWHDAVIQLRKCHVK